MRTLVLQHMVICLRLNAYPRLIIGVQVDPVVEVDAPGRPQGPRHRLVVDLVDLRRDRKTLD